MFFSRKENFNLDTNYRRSTDTDAKLLATLDVRINAIERIIRAIGCGLLLIGVGVSVSLITYFATK